MFSLAGVFHILVRATDSCFRTCSKGADLISLVSGNDLASLFLYVLSVDLQILPYIDDSRRFDRPLHN